MSRDGAARSIGVAADIMDESSAVAALDEMWWEASAARLRQLPLAEARRLVAVLVRDGLRDHPQIAGGLTASIVLDDIADMIDPGGEG